MSDPTDEAKALEAAHKAYFATKTGHLYWNQPGMEAACRAYHAALSGVSSPTEPSEEAIRLVEQLCRDLNDAHAELMKAQGATLEEARKLDWPAWTPMANSIRWSEKLVGRKLAKTDSWTIYPEGQ